MRTPCRHLALIPMLAAAWIPAGGQELYRQIGKDSTWPWILENKVIPVDTTSTTGVTGSTIDVRNEIFADLTNGKVPFTRAIHIHTVGNAHVLREDFLKWTRWYQEDGNTQVFRMHPGEHNVRGTREDAPAGRIEAFSNHSWGRGEWQEWVGTYTIVKPEGCVGPHHCSILQVKDPVAQWAIMVRLKSNGDIVITNNKDASPETPIAANMKGKHLDLRVRDNGHDYQVFYNGRLVNSGSYSRPQKSVFRWGLYFGKSVPAAETLIFVTGATVNPTGIVSTLAMATRSRSRTASPLLHREGFQAPWNSRTGHFIHDPQGRLLWQSANQAAYPGGYGIFPGP